MTISIIIPTYNESATIATLLTQLKIITSNSNVEVIVVDGGSTDSTIAIAKKYSVHIVESTTKGRAAQMNFGASIAKGDILYFVHADVQLHTNFIAHINTALLNGVDFGCYRYKFLSNSKLLAFNAYMTRYNSIWAGGGDQTLFIKKTVFESLNGYTNTHIIMEDFDLVKRAKKAGYKFTILPHNILVSARKYENNSWLRVQLANAIIILAWRCGASQQWMKNSYKKMLR